MPRSMFNGQGYFYNDDRVSGGRLTEDDTLACHHCQAGLKRRAWEEMGGWKCFACDQPLCKACGSAPPQMKCSGGYTDRLEQVLNARYTLEQNAKILGI